MTLDPVQEALVQQFRMAQWDCQQLYRSAAEECVRNYPHLIKQPSGSFINLMNDLHRGLLIKVFVTIVKADWKWSPAETLLTTELFLHVWGERLEGDKLRAALENVMHNENKLRWKSLVGPFDELAPLRGRVGDLETLVMRLANIVAKIDGELHPEEMRQLQGIQAELSQNLRPIPVDDQRRYESPPPGVQAVERLRADGHQVRTQIQHQGAHAVPPALPAAGAAPESREQLLQEAIADLDKLIGLEGIKRDVRELVNFLKIQEERRKQGLPATQVGLHMVFTGNPGTGKTSVARILGRIYGAMGILAKGHLVETDRSGLVAEYAGQTGPKAHRKIDESLDGVLFIDEAYSLISEEGEDAYGHEAVQTLLKRMEDNRDRLIVILAGYPEPMERLLKSNPGLSSRFNRQLSFPDYSTAELGQIFELFCEKNHYRLPSLSRAKLSLGFHYLLAHRDEHFGNGRLVRNVFEMSIRRMANRIASVTPLTKEVLTTLQAEDLVLEGVPDDEWAQLNDPQQQFRVACPRCAQASRLALPHLGKRVKCNACGHAFKAAWGEPM
jgi:hypothetical protein